MESLRKYHVDEHENTRRTLSESLEQQRIEKDQRHAELYQQHEDLRFSTTEQINTHTERINELYHHKLDHENTITQHEMTIHHQKDVHDQHQISTGHNETLQ
jgi:hypothetical protein